MKRVLCVRFPHWPLQRLWNTRPELKSRPLVLYTSAGRSGLQVAACSAEAERAGVVPGLPLAEARALLATHPDVHLERHDPRADQSALHDLAGWCQRFSPLTGIEEGEAPQSLFLDATGVAHLFGGEPGLTEYVRQSFRQRGYRVNVALADTMGAAWAVAHYEPACGLRAIVVPPGGHRQILRTLPVEALRLPETVVQQLHALDLRQVDQIVRLPREALPSRFGPVLLKRLDQAWGTLPESFTTHRPADPVIAARTFEFPLTDFPALEAVCGELLKRIVAQLHLRQQGVLQLWCCLKAGEPVGFSVELVEPRASISHLMELLRLHLERLRPPAEIVQVHLQATRTALLRCHQRELFENSQREEQRELARLIDRLNGRLGAQAVLRPRLYPDHQPEHAVRLEPVVRERQGRSRRTRQTASRPLPLARPLRLQRQPLPVEVMSVVPDGPPMRFAWKGQRYVVERWWGPERIETGWWRSRDVQRDYYRIETAEGRRFWLFREAGSGAWFLHGIFA